jgi:hypothetical protein
MMRQLSEQRDPEGGRYRVTICTGVPSGWSPASRMILSFVRRMQPWLRSWPTS